jgi:predicted TPR repeat methyltransferase
VTVTSDALSDVRLPDAAVEPLSQDEEWCEVCVGGRRRRIRFHDYAEIYAIPGLYERLFYEELECSSPQTVAALLKDELDRTGTDPASLVVLDVGAGNGMGGEQLQDIGARSVVGVDLLPEAAMAAERDRPGVYDDYLVADLTRLNVAEHEGLDRRSFTCLLSIAALGFGDIPPDAFAAAYAKIAPGGWIALTIKEDFLTAEDPSGFEQLLRRMLDEGTIELRAQHRYRHRLSCQGGGLYYVAIIATKTGELSANGHVPSRRSETP